MKGKKGGAMGGLPVAPVKNNPDTAGKAASDVIFGNPDVISSAKKKTVGAAMGTAAKPRADRAGYRRGGHVKAHHEHEKHEHEKHDKHDK